MEESFSVLTGMLMYTLLVTGEDNDAKERVRSLNDLDKNHVKKNRISRDYSK